MFRKIIKPMCGNCVYCDDQNSNSDFTYKFCCKEGIQTFVDPHQSPCDLYESWANPKYEEENKQFEKEFKENS